MVYFKRFKTFLITFYVFAFLTGCTQYYTFNNKSFSSPENALRAHKEYLNEIQNDIKPISSTIMGDAIIITPSKKTCEALGITRKGSPTKEMTDYLGTYLEEEYSFFSNYLLKSNLFTNVNHVIDDFPHQYANQVKTNYSATIYLDMKSPTQISWFIMVSPENTPKQLHFDKMADSGASKIQSWIYDIRGHLQGGAS